jgi:UDP-2-acetamido-2,6-beta-L-arabino-hexul-4-ose reductase
MLIVEWKDRFWYNSFAKKLYSLYLTYLPKEKTAFDLRMNCDDRG